MHLILSTPLHTRSREQDFKAEFESPQTHSVARAFSASFFQCENSKLGKILVRTFLPFPISAMSAISSPLLSFRPRHSKLSPPFSRPFPLSISTLPKPSLHLLSTSLRSKPLSAAGDHIQLSETTSVTVDASDPSSEFTCFVIRARNKIGLLQVITRVFKVLGLRIEKATVEFEGDFFVKRFFVTDSHGRKIEEAASLDRIEKALRDAIGDGGDGTAAVPAVSLAASRGFVVRRAGLLPDSGERRAKAERLFGLMDGFRKNDPVSLQKDILDHVEFTVARSRFYFDDFEAYQVILLIFLVAMSLRSKRFQILDADMVFFFINRLEFKKKKNHINKLNVYKFKQ